MATEITVLSYIRSGGLTHIAPYNTYKKEDYDRLVAEDEIWETGNGTIFTVWSSPWLDVYLTFDRQGNYFSDTMELSIGILAKPLKQIPEAYSYRYSEKDCYVSPEEILEEVADDKERVIFLKNGTDLHFLRHELLDDDLLVKIVSNSQYREATKELFKS